MTNENTQKYLDLLKEQVEKENQEWARVGFLMNRIIGAGIYPGLGFDQKGWEAWVFFSNPVEGVYPTADEKIYKASSAIQAMEKLHAALVDSGRVINSDPPEKEPKQHLSQEKYNLVKVVGETTWCEKCNQMTESDVVLPVRDDLPIFSICWNCHDVRQSGIGSLEREEEMKDHDKLMESGRIDNQDD